MKTTLQETEGPGVPVWLNLDAVVPPEMRDTIARVQRLTDEMLEAVVSYFTTVFPLSLEVNAAIDQHGTSIDDWSPFISGLVGWDRVDAAASAMQSMFEHLADGRTTADIRMNSNHPYVAEIIERAEAQIAEHAAVRHECDDCGRWWRAPESADATCACGSTNLTLPEVEQ